jgi:hypothetical protein
MSGRTVAVVTAGLLLAAFVVGAPRVLAGPHVRAGQQTTPRPQPAPVVVVRPAAPVTISLTPAAPAPAESGAAYISLRGPDGQVRRFAVEGGAAEVSARVIVLRPGESLTIQLTTNK